MDPKPEAPRGSLEKEKKAERFEDLNLENLSRAEDPIDTKRTSESEVVLQDEVIKIVSTYKKDMNKNILRMTFDYRFSSPQIGALFSLELTRVDGGYDAYTYIGKQKGPQGLGLELYEKGLVLLQTLANVYQVPIRHKLSEQADMPVEKWHKIFDPVIAKHGYTVRGDKGWLKEYKPTLSR